MSTALAAADGTIVSADNDQMLVDLFINTKRSPNTVNGGEKLGHSSLQVTSRYT